MIIELDKNKYFLVDRYKNNNYSNFLIKLEESFFNKIYVKYNNDKISSVALIYVNNRGCYIDVISSNVKGDGELLIKYICNIYEHIRLICKQSLIRYYKRLGFKINGNRDSSYVDMCF